MTSEGDCTRQFVKLVWEAVRDPQCGNGQRLDKFTPGDDLRIPLVRMLACRAMDWAVFEYPEYHQELGLRCRV